VIYDKVPNSSDDIDVALVDGRVGGHDRLTGTPSFVPIQAFTRMARWLRSLRGKENTMRALGLFVAGLIVGTGISAVLAQGADAPADRRGVMMMNHVAINVPDLTAAAEYYAAKMGYREAFRVNDAAGKPRIIYLHISRDTFLELNQAGEQRPPGFAHYGIQVERAADAVAAFRERGVIVTNTNVSDTKAILANITDPYMGRIELAELPAESLHRQAIERWAR
jgi:catechol 2,3-dioxygenase-like lactoylglutathione lyase family enzyme